MPATSGLSESLAHSWAGARNGRVTLVLHGGGPGCHATSDFAEIIARQPERRWLAIDLPGYGRSIGISALPSVAGFSAALEGTLEDLGQRNVDVLTQSLGGTVVLHLAARRPELFDRLVVVGSQPGEAPGGVLSTTRDPDLGKRARSDYYGGAGPTPERMRHLMAALEWYDGDGIPDETVLARYRASITTTSLPSAGAPPMTVELGDVLADVAAPTLVVWGRHDPFAGPDYAAALTDALPRGDLCVVGRTAHHPQAERPELVGSLVDAFLGAAE